MFGFWGNEKRRGETALSLSFFDRDNKKVYEVSYESCEFNDYARVKVLEGYCEKMNMRFKHSMLSVTLGILTAGLIMSLTCYGLISGLEFLFD